MQFGACYLPKGIQGIQEGPQELLKFGRRRPLHLVLAAAVCLVVILSACSRKASVKGGPPAQVDFSAKDYYFQFPSKIKGGLVSLNMKNEGTEPHQAQLFRLNSGITTSRFYDVLLSDRTGIEAIRLGTPSGGPNVVGPGLAQRTVVNLRPGNFAVVCFVPGKDGVTHAAKGMIFPVTVSGTGAPASPPKAESTIVLKDFKFEMPKKFDGKGTFRAQNKGGEPHELVFLALKPGKNEDEIRAFFASLNAGIPPGEPPFEFAGGSAGMKGGYSAWITVNLKPGPYLAICFYPDSITHKTHADLGMIRRFSIKG